MIILIALLLCVGVVYEVLVFSIALWLGIEIADGAVGYSIYFSTVILGNALPLQLYYWFFS